MQCTQTEVVQVFGSFNYDDFGFLTKTHQFTIYQKTLTGAVPLR